jgi:formylglycine-generating enzyme required for sulfatase activity
MKRMRLWRWVVAAIWLAGTAQAWRPSGWTWWDWPWVCDAASGDWHWFSPGDSQWIYANPPGNDWALLPQSGIAHGWSYWNGDWALDNEEGTWCWRNTVDAQWCVNMRTDQWSLLGQVSAEGEYLVVDLSGGPAATTYPVRYLAAMPPGGWADAHKSTKLVMRLLPSGTFTMGSPEGEPGRGSDETQRQVTLTQNFYIGVFEVTQRQWELVMGNRPSFFTNATFYAIRPVEQVSYHDIRENPDNSGFDPNWPQSARAHADSFMGRLRAKTGLPGFDLPTEAQWEYACRAGMATALNSGANLTDITVCPNMSDVGRYWYNGGLGFSEGCAPSAGTALAGSYLPNTWGLYDMHGNVWECCLDWYGAYAGGVQDPSGAASGSYRALRGGGWYSSARQCRSASRGNLLPDDRFSGFGFRVAMPLP